MAEFKYEITQELGVISEGKYNIELNNGKLERQRA